MPRTDFDRKVKRISQKNWSLIKGSWLEYLPDIEKPGLPPESSISENPLIEGLIDKI